MNNGNIPAADSCITYRLNNEYLQLFDTVKIDLTDAKAGEVTILPNNKKCFTPFEDTEENYEAKLKNIFGYDYSTSNPMEIKTL